MLCPIWFVYPLARPAICMSLVSRADSVFAAQLSMASAPPASGLTQHRLTLQTRSLRIETAGYGLEAGHRADTPLALAESKPRE